MKHILAGILPLILLLSGCARSSTASGAQAELFAMDTVMDLQADGPHGQDAVARAQAAIETLDGLLDRTEPGSEISAVNAGAGSPVTVSPMTANLIAAALRYSAATGGAMDPTVAPVMDLWGFTREAQQVPQPGALADALSLVDAGRVILSGNTVTLAPGQAIDLGAIAKGYASDCVESAFRACAVTSGCVSLGGNVFVLGGKPDGSAWRVGVRDPLQQSGNAVILSLQDAYAVTSGGYQRYFEENGQRYHHIINPADGYPADSGLLSVTVVAAANGSAGGTDPVPTGNGTLCDAFSTALFVLGEDAALDFWRTGGYEFDLVLITDDGRVVLTPGLEDCYEAVSESGYTYEIAG